MKKAIEVKNIKKNYKNFELGKFDLDVESGKIIGLIGENGAGKTTLIKAILDIIKKDDGSVRLLENDNNEKAKEEIGIVLDNIFFPEILNANDINRIMSSIYKSWDKEIYYKFLKKFDLPVNNQIKNLSKGMRKQLEIICALSHKPKLLILDEPTSGLDPVVRSDVLDIFEDFVKDEEHTILFSTHITSDLEHIADRIVFIDNGKKILDEDKELLLNKYGVATCDENIFKKIDKSDRLRFKKNRDNYQILIDDIKAFNKKYKGIKTEKITIEELMVLVIKGEK